MSTEQGLVPQQKGGGELAPAYRVPRLNGPITSVDVLINRIQAMKQQAFVLCPFTSLDIIPPNFVVSERLVVLSPNPDDKDVYRSGLFCKKEGEVALAKNGVLKIIQAGGATVLWSKQVDDGSDPYYVEWSTMLRIRGLDGNYTDYPGSKRIDLRDNSPELGAYMTDGKLNEGQLRGARSNIVSLAETKAILRAGRGQFVLKHTYLTKELLTKPFLMYALVANVDMSDPFTRHMAEAAALGVPLFGEGGKGFLDMHSTQATLPPGEPSPGEPPADTPRVPLEQPIATQEQPAQTTTGAAPGQQALFEPPPDDPQEEDILLCTCPCSCQKELPEAQYASSVQKIGSPRCNPCYPGQYFDFARHSDLGDLCIKELPGYTPEQAEARRKQLLQQSTR
jgi:hypothetical protein